MILRSYWLLLAAAGVLSAGSIGVAETPPQSRPNILLIFADNMGYGDLGCYGCPDIRTPVLDQLAAEGVRFTNYYAAGPECTPTRTALMTGRYPQRVGGLECAIGSGNVGRYDDAIRLSQRHDLGLPPSANTLVRLLKQTGFSTVGFGKWHLGYEPKFLPPRHGFDYFLASLGGTVDYFYHNEPNGTPALYENDQPVRRDGYMTDLITDGAIHFLRDHDKQKPFFLYLPYTAPSAPLQDPNHKPPVPKISTEWNSKDWQAGTRQTYALIVERLDQGIGRVLETLDEAGLSENSLVIFASDNGGNDRARNAPFSGYTSELFEGGIHVPCMVRWPGVLPQGVVTDRPAITMDLSVSIARAVGAPAPEGRSFDGIDILKQIEEDRPAESRTLFWRARRGDRTWRAVRRDSLKYLSRQDGNQMWEHLFDLQRDPGEKRNLISSRPQDGERLRRLLVQWEEEVRPAR